MNREEECMNREWCASFFFLSSLFSFFHARKDHDWGVHEPRVLCFFLLLLLFIFFISFFSLQEGPGGGIHEPRVWCFFLLLQLQRGGQCFFIFNPPAYLQTPL